MKVLITLLVLYLFAAGSPECGKYIATSKADPKYVAYQDSLLVYNTSLSIADSLTHLFRIYSGSKEYDTYFYNTYHLPLKFGQEIDSTLGSSEFVQMTSYPDSLSGDIFQSSDSFGLAVNNQLHRLDTLKIMPYAKAVAAEMPTLYVYKKPCLVVTYHKPYKCWLKAGKYTVLDGVTHFMLKEDGKTSIPYNIRQQYIGDTLVKTEWVSPMDEKIVIKTF